MSIFSQTAKLSLRKVSISCKTSWYVPNIWYFLEMLFSVFPLFLNSWIPVILCFLLFSYVYLVFSVFLWASDPVISSAGINANETLLKASLGVLWSPHEHFIPQFIVRHLLWRRSANVVTCSQLTFFTLEQVQVNERRWEMWQGDLLVRSVMMSVQEIRKTKCCKIVELINSCKLKI